MSNLKKVGKIGIINFFVVLVLSFGVALSQEPFTVTGVNPADGATDVSVYTGPTVQFSADLDMNTITPDSFFVTDSSGTKLPIYDRYITQRSAFLQLGIIAPGTKYTVHVTTAVQNIVGTPLTSAFTSTFTTALYLEPFTVTGVNPADGATDVSVYTGPTVQFSADLDMNTITPDSFFVTDSSGTKLPIYDRYITQRSAFLQLGIIAPGTKYTVHVTTAVQNVIGTPLASEFTSSFTTAGEPETMEIAIDIKKDRINPKSNGKIQVAILSTNEFNAPEMVDINSLTFGRSGGEESLASCDPKPKDENKDGLKDLICKFHIQNTGFQCGDTVGTLKGKTVQDTPIGGSDSVNIAPCK